MSGRKCTKEFAEVAEEEGFKEIAAQMRLVAAVEKAHEERYRKLLQNIQEDIVFRGKDSGPVAWVCRNCVISMSGKRHPPYALPAAIHRPIFERRAENY